MMNQLVSVDDKLNGKVYNYTYDAGGNLISETVTDSNGTTSNAYEYNNSNWGDVLTSYNGQSITYDEIGNPLTYRDGMSMTWKNGRQLATLTNGDTSISYGYDSDSVRTTKTVNGVKYTYAYLNGQLLYETRGDAKFYYSYDANGILYNVRYTLTDGGTEYSYYYTHNSRGDIVGIYNGAGELKAHYEYDAWGNVISITDNNGNAITSPNHIGNLNPFRYRGYYQDTETGLYYLMSRYYDPITHRFINADGYFQSGGSILDANTFAYCGNNPICYSDPNGDVRFMSLRDLRKKLVSGDGDKLHYDVRDITSALKKGYNYNSIMTVTNDWYIFYAEDVAYAINKSIRISVGGGFGLGSKYEVSKYFDAEAYLKFNFVQLDISSDGNINYGSGASAGAGVSIFTWDNSVYRMKDNILYSSDEGSIPDTIPIVSYSCYVGIGCSIDVYINYDIYSKALRRLI